MQQIDSAFLAKWRTQSGKDLQSLSMQQPTMVVFLRHFGCTFCREALADLAEERTAIEAQGTNIVAVHMSLPERADAFFAKYDLTDLERISDPSQALYQHFSLQRGKLGQLFGWKSWARGFVAGILNGHLVGKEEGDGFQMPGVFLLEKGKITRAFLHESAADRPDYVDLATCPIT
ncbi:MAG: peroxiredoxin-like family protein [Bacteroidota bacterium]